MTHSHHHHHHHSAASNIRVALSLNLAFAAIELIGGLLTQSVAILSDAVHDLGDSMSLGLAWYLQEKSQKSSDAKYSYGYRRLSLLSAVFTGVFLLVASIFILIETVGRFMDPVQPKAEGMFGLAILGIAVNGYAAWKTSHGASMNEKVISWHMIEDLLGWITILLGSIVMMFIDAPYLDPIMSAGFTIFILKGVYGTLTETIRLFLQGVPVGIDVKDIIEDVNKIHGIQGVHDCHTWSLDGETHVLTMHVVVPASSTMDDIKKMKELIRNIIDMKGKFHLTIEFESEKEDCPDISCVQEH
ncbi:MAG: cation diffusion facilitator family transporter [Bdellovibrionota bacterium]